MEVRWELQLDPRSPDGPWAVLSRRIGGAARVLGAFALLYAVLVAAALLTPEPVDGLVIVWPAAGLLLLTLWLSERRFWLVILLLQVGIELLLGLLLRGLSAQLLAACFAHTLAALVGAAIVRRMLAGRQGVHVAALLLFSLGAAAGAAVGVVFAGHCRGSGRQRHGPARHVLVWWLSGLVGALTTLPALLSWLMSYRFAPLFPALSKAQRLELAALLVVQLAVVMLVFAAATMVTGRTCAFRCWSCWG